jgi:hypothetical protein
LRLNEASQAARRRLISATGAVVLLLAGCGTVVEEASYAPLALGDDKPEVLRKLNELATVSTLQPAVNRPDATTEGPVHLAAAPIGDGALTAAEREYLLAYDLWYFEESTGKRSALLTFASGALTRIEVRREARWWERVF